MRSRHADLARKVGVSLAATYVLATGSAFAHQGPVTNGFDVFQSEAFATLNYWTPERIRSAVAKPFPRGALRPGSEAQSAEALAFDPTATIGFAPGWRPGLLRQPTPDTRFKISGDDPQYQQLLAGNLPQTTPPFVPPAARNDLPTTH